MNYKNLSEDEKFAVLVNYKIMLANRNIMLFLIHEELKRQEKIKKPKMTEIKKPKSTLSEIKPAMEKTEYIRKLVEAIIRSNIIRKENIEKL